MKLLTLTPEAQVYALAIVIVYSLSCGPLADFLQQRFAGPRRGAFLPIYIMTMSLVTGFALLVLDLPSVTHFTWIVLATSVPLGLAAGAVAWWSELAIKRLLLRKELLRPRSPWQSVRSADTRLDPQRGAVYRQPWLGGGWSELARARPDSLTQDNTLVRRPYILGALLVVAMLEEVLLRGVLVELCLRLPWATPAVLCLIATVVAFALSHLRLGYSEVLAKLPLGILALLAVLLTRSVLPAIITHLLFNFRAWQVLPPSSGGAVPGRGRAVPRLRLPR